MRISLLRTIAAACGLLLSAGACTTGQMPTPSGAAPTPTSLVAQSSGGQNLRLEIVVVEGNNAVTTATASKRPSQWEGPVMQLVFDKKATSASCVTTAVVTFTNMYTERGGVRVNQNFAEGPYDLGQFVLETKRIERTGAKAFVVRRKVNEPAKPPGNYYFQEITVPLIDGRGAVYLPGGPILASDNPVMGVALPGYTLRALPQGNDSNIRWSTPENREYGTINELKKSLANEYHNDTVVLVVPPCEGKPTS